MARKRMIDPDFWSDEALGACKPTERLLFMGLISQADDDGRLRGTPSLIRSQVFPYDDDISTQATSKMLDTLARQRLIVLYKADGQSYIWVRNFKKHQSINKPIASKLPAPPLDEPLPEDSRSTPVALPPNRKEEKGIEKNMDGTTVVPSERARDELFEAVTEVCYGGHKTITPTERSRANKAVVELRTAEASPGEVRAFATAYRARSPDYDLTPQTITKGLSTFRTNHSNGASDEETRNRNRDADAEVDRILAANGVEQPGLKPFGPSGGPHHLSPMPRPAGRGG